MSHSIRRAGLLSVALSCLAGAASAQVIAYEGFNYPSGASLLGQNAGTGFASPWQTAGYGAWSIGAADSLYIKSGLQLLTSGRRAESPSGGFQRTLSLSQPLGSTPGAVWISFVARQTAGSTNASWLGVKLPCSGSPNPYLFLGKPYAQPNWGADAGLPASVSQTSAPAATQALIVARLDLRAGADDVHVWINPSLSTTPADAAADLVLPSYGDFAGMTKIVAETGAAGGVIAGVLDEIRLGGTFADVAPVKPGITVGGFELDEVGTAIFEPTPEAGRVRVNNIGSSGQDGVEIKWRKARGASMDIHPSELAPGASVKIKHRGWDGLIYHRESMDMGPAGPGLTWDYSPAHITGVRIVGTDSSGAVVQSDFYDGPVGFRNINGGVFDPGPCPGGGHPSWVYTTILYNPPIFQNGQWIYFDHIWVYRCPGDNSHVDMTTNTLRISGIGQPGLTDPAGLQSTVITASGMPSFDVSDLANQFDGASVSGLGDVLVDETCSDGSECNSWQDRRLPVRNIGSSGQDGVEIKWRQGAPSTQGSFSLGDVLAGHGSAHVMMGSSDAGLPPCSLDVAQSPDGRVLVTPDYSAVGAEGTVVTGYDADGHVTGEVVLAPGEPLPVDQVICGPNAVPVWGWYTMWVWTAWPVSGSYQTIWGVIGCNSMGGGGHHWPDTTARFAFSPLNPLHGIDVSSMAITGAGLTEMKILSLSDDQVLHCSVDFNNDGFLDFFDYDDYVSCFETGACPAGRSPDFNGDGFADFFDYDDFVGAFEQGC